MWDENSSTGKYSTEKCGTKCTTGKCENVHYGKPKCTLSICSQFICVYMQFNCVSSVLQSASMCIKAVHWSRPTVCDKACSNSETSTLVDAITCLLQGWIIHINSLSMYCNPFLKQLESVSDFLVCISSFVISDNAWPPSGLIPKHLCSHLTALWRYINFVLLLLLLLWSRHNDFNVI